MPSSFSLVSSLVLCSDAFAVGGSFAGGADGDVPTSAATHVSIARDATGATLIVTAQVARDTTNLAMLWPAVGIEPSSAVALEPLFLGRIEASTRPRVEEIRCDELVEIEHWRTPPGCSSYDYVEPEPLRGEAAIESLAQAPSYAQTGLEIALLSPEMLDGWLTDRGLTLEQTMAAALKPHLDRGESILAVHPDAPISAGLWLPPVRFRISADGVAPDEIVLPLTLGTGAASTRHVLHVFTLDEISAPAPEITNYPQAYIEDECLLPAGMSGEEWIESARSDIEVAAALPTWVLEYASPADTCSPCTDEPLDAFTLGALGLDALPSGALISRIWASALPNAIDEDVIVSFTAGADHPSAQLHLIAPDDALQFAFPVCGQGFIADPGTCDNVHAPESGCQTAPFGRYLPRVALSAVFGVLLLSRRRRFAALVLCALLSLSSQALARPADPSPRTELFGAVALVGTDRVVPEGLSHGAPWVGNPFLSLGARQSLFAWRDGKTVGIFGQVRSVVGHAAPFTARGAVNFTLVEPILSFDIRHGRFEERSPCAHLRYGAGLALPILAPSTSAAQVVPSGALHVGYGWWLGRGLRRPLVELQLSLIPRTDGYETRYHPQTAIPGFIWYPGTVNLWLSIGAALYGPTQPRQ